MSNENKIEHLENIINLILSSGSVETRSDTNEILNSFGIKTKHNYFKGRGCSYETVESFNVKPLYSHDCDKCVFLGSTSGYETEKDLYWCCQNGMPTVIARASDKLNDYISGLCFTLTHDSIAEAVDRAKRLGLQLHHTKEDLD